jgi:cellulose synthase/poly-beta-1,6-N-acetylglucosamine synthase-like glycosyltransferase
MSAAFLGFIALYIFDVFDIMIKLKENNVTQIMKFLSIPNASMITEKLKKFGVNNEKKE